MLVLKICHLAGGIKHNHDKGKYHYGHDFIYIIIVLVYWLEIYLIFGEMR